MTDEVLAIMPEHIGSYAGLIDPPELLALAPSARRGGGDALAASAGGVAVMGLVGIIRQHPATGLFGGGAGLTQFQQAFKAALADDSCASILIDVDSPGGSVYGVEELANEIYAARGKKRIAAVANSLAASAAYWIASAAGELYVTPGGEVGSIGVYAAHMDRSKQLRKAGIDTKLVSAGKFKVEGNPYQPLDEEARAFMQSRVDDYYSKFTRTVARNRGVSGLSVRSGMGQGRVLGAEAAKTAGMVDGIATFDDVVRRLLSSRR
ncbi:signal peptide peptidase SppA [Paraburkholderia sp. BL6665CI2N2]|uniref:S49 family peptidase n=1 Tax=Paraburkholderia sp. BL6665CI2N2 TaxID=1938806 RepID=UPI001066D084|nr:S49 family peptidase [Paraburkholderia sp. BL6665CI2N2]TDY23936.1 signal peptide peptidase SppA [Paraburkholderia sp. BL6665CI2N2]